MKRELAMECPVEFGTVPDCDCPYEHWHIGHAGCCLDIHLEEDGSVHVILETGDWDRETSFLGLSSLDEARERAFVWAGQQIGEAVPRAMTQAVAYL